MIKQLLTISCIALAWGCKRDFSDMRVEEKFQIETAQAIAATVPTATTLRPIEDVFVRSGRYADKNFGSDTALAVKGCDGDYKRYTYLKFVLPSGSTTITKATLRLYGGNEQDATGINVQIYNTTSPWRESTVTYNNRPKHPGAPLASQAITGQVRWHEWDLTSFAKGRSDTIGIMLKNTSNQNRYLHFNSRENQAYKPQLVLSSDAVSPATDPAAVDTGRYDRIFTVWFENKSVDNIFGDADAPYINSLKAKGVSFSNFNACGHPSYPNYITVFSGSSQGVTSGDCINGQPFDKPNLYTSLHAAGKSFAWYSEKLPATGSDVCSAAGGLYREKHNPTTIWKNVPGSVNKRFEDVDWQDASVYKKLENCVMITPDMDDCMHDTNVKFGDTWLKTTLGKLIEWCRNPANRSLFVVYFDEGTSSNNKIPVVMIGANTKPGHVVSSYLSHYAFTRMILSHFGGAVDIHSNVSNATKITGIWQ